MPVLGFKQVEALDSPGDAGQHANRNDATHEDDLSGRDILAEVFHTYRHAGQQQNGCELKEHAQNGRMVGRVRR